MSSKHLRNISISQFEAFLELAQCKYIHTKDGHAKYTRTDLRRPIVFQTHIDPVPEFIIQNNLRILSYNKKTFFEILEGKVIVKREGNVFYLEKVSKK